jgi:hypothetical protein
MLACAFAGHGLIAMAGGLAVGALEHWPYRPDPRKVLALTLALASYYFALAGLESGFLTSWRDSGLSSTQTINNSTDNTVATSYFKVPGPPANTP